MNTFGTNIRLTTFGESHGKAMGGILDGMPSLVKLDFEKIQMDIERRAPGRNLLTTQRREPDEPEFLSGITDEGVTLGTPIGFIIRNQDQRSADYSGYQGRFRPNHGDFTYFKKYGIADFRGGGRASARETVSWVVAGAIVRQWLFKYGVEVKAEFIETNSVAEAKKNCDSTGGIVKAQITGLPIGIGEPVFDKLHSRLAAAMMSINAAKAFEYGDGIDAAYKQGIESLDLFKDSFDIHANDGELFQSNHCGGIQGGISNGMPIDFKVWFKPTPTVMVPVSTYNSSGEKVIIDPKGRHDPCVAIRAVAIVEAMALLTIGDMFKASLMNNR